MKTRLFLLLLTFMISCNQKPDIEPLPNQTLYVSPSPAVNDAYVWVRNKDKQSLTLQVFNPKGELLVERTQSEEEFSIFLVLNYQPSGRYHVILKSDKVIASKAFVKL